MLNKLKKIFSFEKVQFVCLFIVLTVIAFKTLILWIDAAEVEENGRIQSTTKYIQVMQQ